MLLAAEINLFDHLGVVIAGWKLSDMLPRAFKDERKMPETIQLSKIGTK
jgi:hypothetical protein